MKKTIGALVALGLVLCGSNNVLGDAIDDVFGVLYPEIDFKYIQDLPNGHMHKNKPRYRKGDWRILESQHFKIYTYGESNELAEFYLSEAEKIYEEFSREMKMNAFSEKIKVIIYDSVRDFEETNILPGLIPEGLGGLTEMIKRKRVVVAFRDSPVGFRALLRHELTHRYQAELLESNKSGSQVGGNPPPLWFMEGHAEHRARSRDVCGELIVRDGYLNNSLASVNDDYWPTHLVYSQGPVVCRYLAEKYRHKGDVISEILRKTSELGFEKAFQAVTGQTLKDFSKEVDRHIEETYHYLRPKADICDDARSFGSGILLASSGQFFITHRYVLGRDALFINWSDGKNISSEKLVEDDYLKTEVIRNHPLAISPDFGFYEHGASFGLGNSVVYAVDSGGKDAIRIRYFSFDQEKRKFQVKRAESYLPKGVRDIQHPIMVSDDEIAFVGREDVFAEVFLFNKKTGEVKKLTSSMKRTCRGLAYSRTLNILVTSVENEKTLSYDLALGNLKTGTWQLITETKENEFDPEFSLDGKKLLYVSDANLVHNIHLYDFESKAITALTDAKIGVLRPKWFGEDGLMFNSVKNLRLLVQIAQWPTEARTGLKTNFVDKAEDQNAEPFLKYIPNSKFLTIMETVVSDDQTKALFVVNRKLSLETLRSRDSEIMFYVVDLTTEKVVSFTLNRFKQVKRFGRAEFLAGTNLLLYEKSNSCLYDWEKETLYRLAGSSSGTRIEVLGFGKKEDKTRIMVSGSRRYILLANNEELRVYDVISKKIVHKSAATDVVAVDFVGDDMLALRKGDLVWLTEGKEKFVSWYPLPDKQNCFVISQSRSRNKHYSIWLFDIEKKVATLLRDNLAVIKDAKIENGALVVSTENWFGRKRTLEIRPKEEVAVKDEPTPYGLPKSLLALDPMLPLTPREFDVKPIPHLVKEPSPLPRIYSGYGGGSIGAGVSSLALYMVGFDEINDKAFFAYLFLENLKRGLANFSYYDFSSGRSLGLSYRNFDTRRQRFEISATQNIFLGRHLNWDVTLKEQYVNRIYGRFFTRKWLQTKLETTFSVDTTINDRHGPISGSRVFTGIEVGVNDSFKYQNLDLSLDARHYLLFSERMGLALRLAGGHSFGSNPTSFVWGGNQTLRGIPLFSQSGNSYVLQSSDLRIPIFDVIGAQLSGPLDSWLMPVTRLIDVRGGIYNDIGDLWCLDETPRFYRDDHYGFKMQYSTGVFLNAPTLLGINLRYNKSLWGKKGWNFWLGYNW